MLTIIIPTFNRPDFLIRLLNYYAEQHCKYTIHIGDSSDLVHAEPLMREVDRLKEELNIVYEEYKGLNEPQCTYQMLTKVSTPYLAFLPDDDFIVPNGISACINFLEKNSDYSVALGRALLFELDVSGPYGCISGTSDYGLCSIEDNTGQQRLISHLRRYTNPNFGVHRTKEFCAAYQNVSNVSEINFTELLPNCMTAIYGKVKRLDCLYLIRQGHDKRFPTPDVYDMIASAGYTSSYQAFHDSLVEALIEKGKLNEKEAHDVVKKAFWSYLNNNFRKMFQLKYEISRVERIKRCVKKIPALASFFQRLRSTKLFSKEMSLTALMDKKSPYYEDFMPVFEIVSQVIESEEKICEETQEQVI